MHVHAQSHDTRRAGPGRAKLSAPLPACLSPREPAAPPAAGASRRGGGPDRIQKGGYGFGEGGASCGEDVVAEAGHQVRHPAHTHTHTPAHPPSHTLRVSQLLSASPRASLSDIGYSVQALLHAPLLHAPLSSPVPIAPLSRLSYICISYPCIPYIFISTPCGRAPTLALPLPSSRAASRSSACLFRVSLPPSLCDTYPPPPSCPGRHRHAPRAPTPIRCAARRRGPHPSARAHPGLILSESIPYIRVYPSQDLVRHSS